jgi:hypothetical protein
MHVGDLRRSTTKHSAACRRRIAALPRLQARGIGPSARRLPPDRRLGSEAEATPDREPTIKSKYAPSACCRTRTSNSKRKKKRACHRANDDRQGHYNFEVELMLPETTSVVTITVNDKIYRFTVPSKFNIEVEFHSDLAAPQRKGRANQKSRLEHVTIRGDGPNRSVYLWGPDSRTLYISR